MTNDAQNPHEERRIGAIVAARMTSRRLPGKVLRSLAGKPLLQYVLESLRRLDGLSGTLVATSLDPSDDPIAEFCGRFGCDCFRGSLASVADRFLQAARAQGFSAFVRVSGDSPLWNHRVGARAVSLFDASRPDLATNVFPRTYPAGMSVEVVRTQTFERMVPELVDPADREHVTRFFYRHPEQFRIVNFTREEAAPAREAARQDGSVGDVHLAVDTEEQFALVARIIESMERPHWDYSADETLRLAANCLARGTPAPRPVLP